MQQRPQLNPDDALIIVDVQNDFCPGGALPVNECRQMIVVLNQWIAAAIDAGSHVVATRDWHPADHISFQNRGGPWPPHCVQGTNGARFCKELHLPANTQIVSKGTDRNQDNYSGFENTGLATHLRDRGISRVWIAGLVLEVCVRATILDALTAGFETHLITDGTRPIQPEDSPEILTELQSAGTYIH